MGLFDYLLNNPQNTLPYLGTDTKSCRIRSAIRDPIIRYTFFALRAFEFENSALASQPRISDEICSNKVMKIY